MASIIKIADIVGIKEMLQNYYKALRNFFGTKTEMDVVATALTDLDRRIDEAMPTIEVGTVTTVGSGEKAKVENVGTGTKVVLNFSIPRGEQGDMKELDDSSDYCTVWPIWQMRPNANFEFADRVLVPIPSISAISSLADCIKQTNKLTLAVGENIIKQTYDWNELHWSKKCSRSDRIVYAAKYATPDADFPSVNHTTETDVSKKVKRPPSIIDIAVTSVKGTSGVARYVQVTIENEYGRAYYRGTV